MTMRIQYLSLLLTVVLVGSTMGSVYSDTVINNTSPTIYWDFQDGSLDDLATAGGNNTATLWSYSDATNYIQTEVAGPGAIYTGFENTNEGLAQIGNKGATAYFVDGLETFPNISTTSYSMSCWVNSSVAYSYSALSYMLSRGDVTNPNGTNGPVATPRDSVGIWGLASHGVGTLMFWDGANVYDSTTVLDDATWYNITLVRDNAEVTLYVDGESKLNVPSAPWLGSTGDLLAFGGRADAVNNAGLAANFYGRLDEMVVWNRALTDAEVASMYEIAPVVIPDPNVDYAGYISAHAPDAYWRFQESAGATVAVDEMGLHDLTLNAAATLGSAGPSQSLIPGLPAGNTAIHDAGTGPIATVKDILGGASGYTRNYTSEMWIKIDSSFTSGNQCLLYRNDVDNPSVDLKVGDFFGITFDEETSEIHLVMTNGILDASSPSYDRNAWLVGETALETDQWYHVAMTSEDNNTTLFVNGQQDAYGLVQARGGYFLGDGTWTIGSAGATDADLFDAFVGEIDELAIYREVFTPELFQERFPEQPAIAGDANGDGKVDGSDVTILAGNWQVGVDGVVEATWEMGDFNGDKKVDGSDVTILAGNWQYGVTAAAAAVPEPSTLVMLLALASGLLIWRRR